MIIRLAKSPTDLAGILELQRKNLKENVSLERQNSDGFVTVQHDLALLTKMNGYNQQIIAVNGGSVVGYAIVMVKELQSDIPVLQPMFKMFTTIDYQGKKLSDFKYYVMGQVCVDEAFRGKGVFKKLYEMHKSELSSSFDFCLTEVSTSNYRSMKAHQNVGFKTVHSFQDKTDEWNIMLWDWEQKF